VNSWIVVTHLDTAQLMTLAVEDAAHQVGLPYPPRVLAVSNGSSQETRRHLETVYDRLGRDLVLPWWYEPALPSLSGVWNRALDFCWGLGAEEVLVANADVRLSLKTYEALRQARFMTGGLFVSAIGRREHELDLSSEAWLPVNIGNRGGPDFSCFVIARECHAKYHFDENFTPCYTEDVDFHRRMMLGGDGSRIFSVNVPYVHHASGTLKEMSSERQRAVGEAIERGSRTYFRQKWGADPNSEIWNVPFFGAPPDDGSCTTTPDLQSHCCGGSHRGGDIQSGRGVAQEAHTPSSEPA